MLQRLFGLAIMMGCASAQPLTFHVVTTPVVGSAYRAVAGDFNHDGNLDLALLVSDGGTVQQIPQGATTLQIFLGASDGTFRRVQVIPIALSGIEIASGDLNGDGRVDLVVESVNLDRASPHVPTLTQYMGFPDGTFRISDQPIPLPSFDVSPAIWTDLNIGDVNGDGKMDIVLGPHLAVDTNPYDEITVLPGNGDGTFGSAIESLTTLSIGLRGIERAILADVTNDGKADLIVNYTLRGGEGDLDVYNGQGDGSMVRSYTKPLQGLEGCAHSGPVTGDFNKDGLLDFAADLCNGFQVTFQEFGHFAPAGVSEVGSSGVIPANGVIAGDLDGDGELDLVFGQGNDLVFLRGDGKGGFTQPAANEPRPVLHAGTSPVPVKIADVNHDGKPDLIVFTDQGIAVLLNDSPPTSEQKGHRPGHS